MIRKIKQFKYFGCHANMGRIRNIWGNDVKNAVTILLLINIYSIKTIQELLLFEIMGKVLHK